MSIWLKLDGVPDQVGGPIVGSLVRPDLVLANMPGRARELQARPWYRGMPQPSLPPPALPRPALQYFVTR